jgi:hypothetical protein
MIKIKFLKERNRKPIDRSEVEHTPDKISGFGASSEYTKTSGHDFNPAALPRYAMEEKVEGDNKLGYELDECGCEDSEEMIEIPDDIIGAIEPEEFNPEDFTTLYEKKDRCYHLAKQKYDVFPSAYASGFIVRCRKGKVGRKKKRNEEVELEEGKGWTKKRKDSVDCNNPKGFSERAHCQGREKNEASDYEYVEDLSEGTFDKEKDSGLHGWFARKGGKGKSKGWVDCNTCRTNPKTGRKTCKTCGRQSGEKRSKYPACRPTPSACTRSGTSKKRGPMRVSWKKKKK